MKDKKQRGGKTKNLSSNLFVLSILIYPLLLFILFYVVVNFNSILMAFKKITITGEETFIGFQNFSDFIADIRGGNAWYKISLTNSLKMYIICLVISLPLYIFFSYVLFKKCRGNKIMRAIVMIPQIISGFIMCLVFKKFVSMGLPAFMKSLMGYEEFPNLLMDPRYAFGTNNFYMIWVSFSTSLIVYPNAMNEIDDGILEAGRIDGINSMFSELWYIILPLIYPTISTFLITGFAAILTNAGSLATFYMYDAPYEAYNMGYLYWQQVAVATSYVSYPKLAAGGLLMTFIVAPLTILLKYLLEKFGPVAEY